MSYNFLINAIKNRVITELKSILAEHPHYKDLEVLNKFPYEERIQQGIIIRNVSAGRVPLSADNFQGTVISYTTYAKHNGSKSLSVEWVREDTNNLANWINREDFSSQFQNLPQENVTISLNEQFVESKTDLDPASSVNSVVVYVNNQRVMPLLVDGKNSQIILTETPPTNSIVQVSYWSRNLAAPGVYQLEITGGDPLIHKYEFKLDALLDKENTLLESAAGYETTLQTQNYPIFPGSLKVRENDNLLNENEDYVVDNETGIITFLQNPPILSGSKITASYRVRGITTGPFEIPTYNVGINTALPGIVIAFGRGVSIGDKQFVIINKKREVTALEYSGKWDMGISLEIYAKDSHMIEEISDIATTGLLFYRKEQLDAEGIALVDVSFGGESETILDEGTHDLYYTGSVDYTFLTEWILHKPLLLAVEDFKVTQSAVESPDPLVPGFSKNYERIV